MTILSVRDLAIHIPPGDFRPGAGIARPVDGISFDITPG